MWEKGWGTEITDSNAKNFKGYITLMPVRDNLRKTRT